MNTMNFESELFRTKEELEEKWPAQADSEKKEKALRAIEQGKSVLLCKITEDEFMVLVPKQELVQTLVDAQALKCVCCDEAEGFTLERRNATIEVSGFEVDKHGNVSTNCSYNTPASEELTPILFCKACGAATYVSRDDDGKVCQSDLLIESSNRPMAVETSVSMNLIENCEREDLDVTDWVSVDRFHGSDDQ